MTGETAPRRVAAKLTNLDKEAIELIKRNGGVVRVEPVSGKPALESDTQIGPGRFARLQFLGLLEPSGDRLLEGPSQTFQLVSPSN